MKWRGRRQSTNVVDQRSAGGGYGRVRLPMGGGQLGGGMLRGGGSIGGLGLLIVAIVIGFWLFGGDLFNDGQTVPTEQTTEGAVLADDAGQFVATVLAETEDTWTAIFAAGGLTYRLPTLVLFSGSTGTGCGFASADTGPFYCPADQRIYIDLSFYTELAGQFGAPGDFAQAYVLAHEVGHHVQNLLGTFNQAAINAPELDTNAFSIRLELQADCYAGIWGYRTGRIGLLEPGDVEEALNAAAQIGDDAIQRRQQGYVVPETFNHGTSSQRVTWFRRGLETGEIAACDTFAARTL